MAKRGGDSCCAESASRRENSSVLELCLRVQRCLWLAVLQRHFLGFSCSVFYNLCVMGEEWSTAMMDATEASTAELEGSNTMVAKNGNFNGHNKIKLTLGIFV